MLAVLQRVDEPHRRRAWNQLPFLVEVEKSRDRLEVFDEGVIAARRDDLCDDLALVPCRHFREAGADDGAAR